MANSQVPMGWSGLMRGHDSRWRTIVHHSELDFPKVDARHREVVHSRRVRTQENEAGASAQRKYDDLTRSWRRRNRSLFTWLSLVCGAIVLLSFLASRMWQSQAWLLGLLAGAALTLVIVLRASPPGWIENWQSGAWGERDTARALRSLEREGWFVLHDLKAGAGNIDHVVVGPTGVYLLDSKRLSGSIAVDESGVTVRRLDDPDLTYRHPGSPHLLSLASQTHDRILATSRINTWVTPVMVLWSDFPQRAVEQRCVYVHGDELVGWLRDRPQRIAPARVQQVAEAARLAWSD